MRNDDLHAAVNEPEGKITYVSCDKYKTGGTCMGKGNDKEINQPTLKMMSTTRCYSLYNDRKGGGLVLCAHHVSYNKPPKLFSKAKPKRKTLVILFWGYIIPYIMH